MLIRVSAAKTMRLLSSHILPRNASDFTCSYLRVDLKNFPPGKNSRTPAYKRRRWGKVLKVPTFTGRGGEGRIWKMGDREWGKRGEETIDDPVTGGELFQGLRGIDAPVSSPYSVHSMN